MEIAKKISVAAVAFGIFAASAASAGSDPELYKLSKYKGFVGEKVKITGINFGKEKGKVMFDDWTRAEILSWSKKKIYIRVPDIAVTKTYKVRVCKRYDDCTRSQKFFVKRKGPELWRIKNLSGSKNYQGKPGDKLKLTGQNFDSANISVLFGNTPGRIISRTKKWIEVIVPELERDRTYAVKVVDGDPDSNTQDFYVTP
jgi:hypothetical protein